jgi:hypothetical protein
MMLLLSTSIIVVLSAQEYDYAEDYGDYQQDGGDYYGSGGQQDMDGGYYAQEGDTLYTDYARHQQEKAGGM